MIEVEIRTFITKEQYEKFIRKYRKILSTEKQISNYYNCEQDFRLMETNDYLQLWLKDGKMHDEARKERVVKIDTQYKKELKDLLNMLNFEVDIKWYRVRNKAILPNGIELCIDYTAGYGYILEVEKSVQREEEVEEARKELMEFMSKNKLILSDKQEFTIKYEYYKNNWRECTKEIDEEIFLN